MTDLIRRMRDFLSARRTSYVRTFSNPPGQEVLADLAKFCRASEPTFHPDPRVHAMLEGRREVWLRIQAHLQLSDAELWAKFGQPNQAPQQE
jgi:hypothetical protein